MSESTIRSRDKTDAYNFENLMSQGIDLLQQLSGDVWTDFNLHDPGITLLEQLCFALTDVVYRSDLDAAQYLTNEKGKIDLSYQGLYGATKVLSSGPVKSEDFEGLFLDKINGLNKIILDIESSHNGDFQIASGVSASKIKRDIAELFHANRPLCQNISRPFEEIQCEDVNLSGLIEIDNAFQAEDILADVILYAEEFISPPPSFDCYDELLHQGHAMEDILQGPFTAKGRLNVDRKTSLLASNLSRALMQRKGVKKVSNLQFLLKKNSKNKRVATTLLENDVDRFFKLSFTETEHGAALKLTQNGKTLRINTKQLVDNINRQRMRKGLKAFSMVVHDEIFPSITQDFWPLDEIYPIYHQLPANYAGAGNQEITNNSKKQQVNSKQINAYLMLFEQFIANSFSNLTQIKTLFSVDERLDKSYFYQSLDHPLSRRLYRSKNETTHHQQLNRIIAENDDFEDRRNRVLDYLLALYAETYPDEDFFRLENSADQRTIKRDLIRAKIALIKHIPQIGYSRLLAQDISKPLAWHVNTQHAMNMSGVQLRTSLYLGLWDISQRSLLNIYDQLSLKLITDTNYEELNINLKQQLSDGLVLRSFNKAIKQHKLVDLKQEQLESVYKELKEFGLFKDEVLSLKFIEQGMKANSYAVAHIEQHSEFFLIFQMDKNYWIKLGKYDIERGALQAAALCQQFLYNIHRSGLAFNRAFLRGLQLNLLPDSRITYQPLFLDDIYDKHAAVDKHVRERFRSAIFDEKNDYINLARVTQLLNELQKHGLFKHDLHIGLLRFGTDINRYRIGYASKKESIILAFRLDETHWIKLATFDDASVARRIAGQCQQFLYAVNRLGEGMHIVEDVFLNRSQFNNRISAEDNDENYQIRVLLPDWLIRFESRDFQVFVETLLHQSCPAHIVCNVYWLNYEDITTFEQNYENWHRQYLIEINSTETFKTNTELDMAADALKYFFVKAEKQNEEIRAYSKGEGP